MLSKPLAIVLLCLALIVAGIGGGYLALKFAGSGSSSAEDDLTLDAPLDEVVTIPAGSPAASPPGTKANAPGAPKRPTGLTPGAPGAVNAPVGVSPSGPAVAPPSAGQTEGASHGPEDVLIPAGQLLDIQLQSPLSSERAKVEDRVEARVLREVRVGPLVAIPVGAKVLGSVTVADKAGKIREPARIGVRFHTLALMGGVELPLVIDPLMHEGQSPAGDSKLKIVGGSATGAVLGWLQGGLAGAVKGGAIGGGAGTATKMLQAGSPAELPAGAQARVELRAPVTVTVQK